MWIIPQWDDAYNFSPTNKTSQVSSVFGKGGEGVIRRQHHCFTLLLYEAKENVP